MKKDGKCRHVPLKGSIIIVCSLMLFESFLAIEKLFALFDGALEKHFISKYNLLFLS